MGGHRGTADDAGAPERPQLLSRVFWYGLPCLLAALVLAYVGLAVAWRVGTPVVPVLGVSMQPKLHAGDVIFIHGVDPKTLKKGDIIAFHPPKAAQAKYNLPSTYTHRIVKIEGSARDGYSFQTRGDNVNGPDPFWVLEKNVVGKYAGHVRYAGWPVLFLRSRQGLIFLAAVAAILVVYFLLGVWERRQEAAEGYQLSLASLVDEARTLRDSMAAAAMGARAPPPETPDSSVLADSPGPRMVELVGEPPEGAALCSRRCHVLLPGAKFDPHSGEPVEVPEPPARAFTPIPNERALVPYVAPGFDFERLEREIHEAVRSSAGVEETMRDLVGAIGEYGEHLRSHTAVMQNLAATTGELKDTTAEMREFLGALTALMTRLLNESRGG